MTTKRHVPQQSTVAAQLLEHSAELYVPCEGMFSAACKAWKFIAVAPIQTTATGAAKPSSDFAWAPTREYSIFVLPQLFEDATDIQREIMEVVDEPRPIRRLRMLLTKLDDLDMAEVIPHLVLHTRQHFEALFTATFVANADARLAFIHQFVEHNHAPEPLARGAVFFDGTKFAGNSVAFVGGKPFVPAPPFAPARPSVRNTDRKPFAPALPCKTGAHKRARGVETPESASDQPDKRALTETMVEADLVHAESEEVGGFDAAVRDVAE